jgi:hypothetical protein
MLGGGGGGADTGHKSHLWATLEHIMRSVVVVAFRGQLV